MIKLNSMGHAVAGRSLFNGISLSLADKKYGLVGPNGVGKTTLAKILAGDISPSSGQVTVSSPVAYFAQNEIQSDLTLGEYLLEIWDVKSEFADLISSLVGQLDFERRLVQLSGGEWMKARLAKAISKSPGFLILDEPSNNLDRAGREVVLNFLKQYSNGLLLISHDRELLNLMDVTIELSNQGASAYGGNFTFYWKMRSAERERHRNELEDLKRSAKKVELDSAKKLAQQDKRMRTGAERVPKEGIPRILAGAMKRTAQVSRGKLVKQAKKSVEISKVQVDDSWSSMKTDPFMRLNFEGSRVPAGRTIAAISQLNWTFHGSTAPLWKAPIDLTIQGPQRWHLLGRNGSGKSTLAKLLVDSKLLGNGVVTGDIKKNSPAVAYLDQRYSLLNTETSIIENIRDQSRFHEIGLRNELAFYGFTGDSVFQKVNTLSGGEILKASLAQIFLGVKIPDIVILDEPTNNLDITSIELLEASLQNFCGAIVVVSHDIEFVRKLGVTHSLDLSEHT
ncbi:MAG: ABC-F family ATP-binding cassette domain-containing protein [Bdellovibrionales bacterium]|nr:ABC-F family ATP-binding cassette domain-containing protein [Bdellovibrionales bacterium]